MTNNNRCPIRCHVCCLIQSNVVSKMNILSFGVMCTTTVSYEDFSYICFHMISVINHHEICL